MKTNTKIPLIASLMITTLFTAASAYGDVLYFNTFVTESDSVADNGWSAYSGASATDASNLAYDANNIVVWSSDGSDPVGSYMFVGGNYRAEDNLLFADVSAQNLNIANLESLTYEYKSDSLAQGEYIAVQVDGSWYRSAVSYGGNETDWTQETFTFSTAAADWKELNFTPGSTLNYDNETTPAEELSGILQAFGFARLAGSTANNTASRFDEVTLNGAVIPEPDSLVLVGLGLLGLRLFGSTRRKHAASGR